MLQPLSLLDQVENENVKEGVQVIKLQTLQIYATTYTLCFVMLGLEVCKPCFCLSIWPPIRL